MFEGFLVIDRWENALLNQILWLPFGKHHVKNDIGVSRSSHCMSAFLVCNQPMMTTQPFIFPGLVNQVPGSSYHRAVISDKHKIRCDVTICRVHELQNRIASLEEENRVTQLRNLEISSQLQTMMQSHCSEALRLLQLSNISNAAAATPSAELLVASLSAVFALLEGYKGVAVMCHRKPMMAELQSTTCYMGLYGVTCHPAQVTAHHLNFGLIGQHLIHLP